MNMHDAYSSRNLVPAGQKQPPARAVQQSDVVVHEMMLIVQTHASADAMNTRIYIKVRLILDGLDCNRRSQRRTFLK